MKEEVQRGQIATLGDPLFSTAFSVWNDEGQSIPDVQAVAIKLSGCCGLIDNVYVTSINQSSPLESTHETVNCAFDTKAPPAFKLGDYPDRSYIERLVAPHLIEMSDECMPTFYKIRTAITGSLVVYDRLMLPVFSGRKVSACITVSRLHLRVDDFYRPSPPSLSPREKQCLGLLASGYSAKQIAARASISQKTAEQHIESLKRKLGARNVAQAVALGLSQLTYDRDSLR